MVKVFNTNGAANMADPDAKKVAVRLAAELRFEPIELGPLWASRLLEPLAVTWIVLSRQQKMGVDFALNVVRRPG